MGSSPQRGKTWFPGMESPFGGAQDRGRAECCVPTWLLIHSQPRHAASLRMDGQTDSAALGAGVTLSWLQRPQESERGAAAGCVAR